MPSRTLGEKLNAFDDLSESTGEFGSTGLLLLLVGEEDSDSSAEELASDSGASSRSGKRVATGRRERGDGEVGLQSWSSLSSCEDEEDRGGKSGSLAVGVYFALSKPKFWGTAIFSLTNFT